MTLVRQCAACLVWGHLKIGSDGLCAGCRSQTGDAFPLAPGTLESVRVLIATPVREAPLQAGPRENVLRVVRSHVLAHAPGNTLVGRGITGTRRPA